MAFDNSHRYERLDSDEARLPENMTRIGYDADTQRYTFRDADGSLWESTPGSQYGALHRHGERPAPASPATAAALAADERTAWRYMLPFFVLIGVFLLFVFRVTRGGTGGTEAPWPEPQCGRDTDVYAIVRGDTCWDVARQWGVDVPTLVEANEGLDCTALEVGRKICVPHNGKIGGS